MQLSWYSLKIASNDEMRILMKQVHALIYNAFKGLIALSGYHSLVRKIWNYVFIDSKQKRNLLRSM